MGENDKPPADAPKHPEAPRPDVAVPPRPSYVPPRPSYAPPRPTPSGNVPPGGPAAKPGSHTPLAPAVRTGTPIPAVDPHFGDRHTPAQPFFVGVEGAPSPLRAPTPPPPPVRPRPANLDPAPALRGVQPSGPPPPPVRFPFGSTPGAGERPPPPSTRPVPPSVRQPPPPPRPGTSDLPPRSGVPVPGNVSPPPPLRPSAPPRTIPSGSVALDAEARVEQLSTQLVQARQDLSAAQVDLRTVRSERDALRGELARTKARLDELERAGMRGAEPAAEPPAAPPSSPSPPSSALEAGLRARIADLEAELARARAASSPAGEDLKVIRGIGPKYEKILKAEGVTSVRQLAEWTEEDVDAFAKKLGIKPERIRREDWIGSGKRASGAA